MFSAMQRKVKLIVPAVAVFAFLAAGGLYYGDKGAGAQTPPDGGSEAQASSEANLSLACGPLRRTYARSNENNSNIANNASSTTFQTILSMNVSTAAGGCVFVTYSGEMASNQATGVNNHCYLRALFGGVEMSPTGSGFRDAVSSDTTAQAATYLWMHRAPAAGVVPVIIQARSNTPNVGCWIDDSALKIDIH
jgi:hypothetical protein